jgi:hypothetical protein
MSTGGSGVGVALTHCNSNDYKASSKPMAGDSVITTFGGDDSPFQAVAKRVMQTMHGIAGFKPPGDAFKAVDAGLSGSAPGLS